MSWEVHARCITLQEVTKIHISRAIAALVQESVKGDSQVETNEEIKLRFPEGLASRSPTIPN